MDNPENYIDGSVRALKAVSEALTPHGIEILRAEIGSKLDVPADSIEHQFGRLPKGKTATMQLTVQVPLD